MDILEYREICLSLPHVEEATPFDQRTLVYKIGGKMFSMADMEDFVSFTVKALPERVEQLCEQFMEIGPGYHMNKRHWITVSIEGSLTDAFIKRLTEESYYLVRNSLPRKLRDRLSESGAV